MNTAVTICLDEYPSGARTVSQAPVTAPPIWNIAASAGAGMCLAQGWIEIGKCQPWLAPYAFCVSREPPADEPRVAWIDAGAFEAIAREIEAHDRRIDALIAEDKDLWTFARDD